MEGDHLNNRTTVVGTHVEPSARINRYFKMAKSAAYNSVYGKLRHGAVLVRGGSVINIAWNKDEYTAVAQRFRPYDCGPATRHAEAQCVLGLSRSKPRVQIYLFVGLIGVVSLE